MESCIHNGKVHYITKLEDFRDVMEDSVYECFERMLEGMLYSERERGYDEAYQDLQDDMESDFYGELESEKEELLDEISELENQILELESDKNNIIDTIDSALNDFHYNGDHEELVERLEELL